MDELHRQFDYVAQAFYETQDDAQSWHLLPEVMKEKFRSYARQAVALLDEAKPEWQLEFPDTAASASTYLC